MPGKIKFRLVLVFLLLVVTTAAADVPRLITFQGQLTDNMGAIVGDATYDIDFYIYTDILSGDLLWSETQTVEVHDGLFSVQLGQNSPLPDSAFYPHIDLFVAMELSGSGVEFAPRIRLTSNAFAFHALTADAAGWAPAAGGWVDDGTIVRLMDDIDSVGIGTASPRCRLDIDGAVNADSGYQIGGILALSEGERASVSVGTYSSNAALNENCTYVGCYAGGNGRGIENTMIGYQAGFVNSNEGNTFIGASAGKNSTGGESNTYIGSHAGYDATGSQNVFIGYNAGRNETGNQKLYIANSATNPPLIYGDFALGRIAIGTTSPAHTFSVITEADAIYGEVTGGPAGAIGVHGKAVATGGEGVRGISEGAEGRGLYGRVFGANSYGVYGRASGSNGFGVYGETDGSTTGIGVYGHTITATSEGVRGIAEGNDGRGVYGRAFGEDAFGVFGRASGLRGRAFYGEANVGGGVGIEVEALGSSGVGLIARSGSGGVGAKIYGNVLIYSNVDQSLIMELGEGLDYAEGFDVSVESTIVPGTVVSIDPDNPGKLTVCTSAYDSKVAGIVAGAKELGSGVRLGSDEFDLDVALAGRVYCNADATTHGIEPGDLLTTSSRAGYAMIATNHDLAQGAIIGKAMERLEQGKTGQILVLVALQ